MEKVFIIIPTYNERENITTIIDGLLGEFSRIHNYEMHILVFDSHSPDGTAELVKKKQQQYPNIHILTEKEKSGLGSAYIKAIPYCYTQLGADIVFEFDADGSHQPHYISKMLEVFQKGADVVVGSRYVPGGSIPSDWAWHRRLLSSLGNKFAQIILSKKLKDYTSGFRGTRTHWLRKIDLNKLISRNYAYKIQLLWELYSKGAKIIEYPIAFIDRTEGKSKFPRNNVLESLLLVLILRLQLLKRYLKVSLTGGIGAIVQIIAFNILRHWLHPLYASAISIELAIINNFIFNNWYSFKDRKFDRYHSYIQWIKKFLLFNFFSLGSVLLQSSIMLIGVTVIGKGALQENLYLLCGILMASFYNFKMYSRFIWNHKC